MPTTSKVASYICMCNNFGGDFISYLGVKLGNGFLLMMYEDKKATTCLDGTFTTKYK